MHQRPGQWRAAGGFVNMGPSFAFLTGNYSIAFWVKTTTTQIDTIALYNHTLTDIGMAWSRSTKS